tara:strand:- start:3286 stop:4095 length:810 start_codon:yes stop_codon:yes gene_type:complete
MICFKSGYSKLTAIYRSQYKIVFNGKTCTSLMSATTYAYNLLGLKEPKNVRGIDVWYIYLDGKDVPISRFYDKAFINSPIPLKCELDTSICMKEPTNVKKSNNVKEPTNIEKPNMNEQELQFTKVRFKFNKEIYDKQSSNDSVCIDSNKRKANLTSKRSKEPKDDNMFIEDGDDEEEIQWTPSNSIWTQNELDYFLGSFPEKAPKLLKIIETYRANSVPKHMCNPLYRCIFQHPVTKENKDVCLGSPILKTISHYKQVLDEFESLNSDS